MKRLQGKLALITGGSGGIGYIATQKYLEEGAEVIITGRNLEKLNKSYRELHTLGPLHQIELDGSDLESIRKTADFLKNFRPLDILINNAGSAGPLQTLDHIPLNREDIEGTNENETLHDALKSLLGCSWLLTNALFKYLSPEASIINISTIFSKTDYFGRNAYVVPKAALNMYSHLLAEELPQKMRINVVYPGPVEGERIETVFAKMDALKGVPKGSTSKEILDKMLIKSYLARDEIANALVFLGSEESSGFSNHDYEVTHGFQISSQREKIEISVSPDPTFVNLNGHFAWILGGEDVDTAIAIAQKFLDRGAEVLLTGSDKKIAQAIQQKMQPQLKLSIQYFDPINSKDWQEMIHDFQHRMFYPNHVFVLPRLSSFQKTYGTSVLDMPLEHIEAFISDEIADRIALAKGLSKMFHSNEFSPSTPFSVLFITNKSDGKGNKLEKILSSAIHQLIRTWRHEELFYKENGIHLGSNIWQLIRYENEERTNLDFTTNLSLALASGKVFYPHIDLCVGEKILYEVPNQYQNAKYNQLLGDLSHKVAFITGGSEGIGRETARILLEGGARVIIASRSFEKLEKTKDFFIKELIASGYSSPENQIEILKCDVSKEKSVEEGIQKIIQKFGKVDYLINNAGITGQEQTLVDIPLSGWKETLNANLISNYNLILAFLPSMKKQGEGYIVNISSQFGGIHFATPPYPNRTDYAVTKAGQRALAEILGPLLGPQVLINAIAPGPVEGDRLRGGKTHTSLYYRRAKINFENIRLNEVYNELVKLKTEMPLKAISKNHLDSLPQNFKKILEKNGKGSSSSYLLTKKLATKLLERLRQARLLSPDFNEESFFLDFQEPPEPFLEDEEIAHAAASILKKTLSTLSLGHMPSEYDIGREVALNIANKSTSGETLYPSCGMVIEKLARSGDFVGSFPPLLFELLNNKNVLVVGDTMYKEMALIASAFCKGKNNQIHLAVGSTKGKEEVSKELNLLKCDLDVGEFIGEDFDKEFDQLIDKKGSPDILISLPYCSIPQGEGWKDLPDLDIFKNLLEKQITNHFQVARRSSLLDNCRTFFVTPSLNGNPTKLGIAFTKFIQTTLAPITVTAAAESSRLFHKATFFQIDCNTHNKSDLYQKKLLDALLLLSLPNESETQSGCILVV